MSDTEILDERSVCIYNGVNTPAIILPKFKIEEFYESLDSGLLAEGKVIKTVALNNKEFVCVAGLVRGEEIISLCVEECVKSESFTFLEKEINTGLKKVSCKSTDYFLTSNRIVVIPEKEIVKQLSMF